MDKIWHYEGRDYPFDITEAGCVSRIIGALAEQNGRCESWRRKWGGRTDMDSLGPMIAEYCAEIRCFFDALFGEGEGRNITGSLDSVQTCDEAFCRFIEFVRAQIDAFARVREEIVRSYRERVGKIAGKDGKAEEHGDPQ